ncbi:aminoglycoside phosphotransferase [Actinobacteria bacterium YIM 96077]|uniref:Maltokinase n=1 Tax=Phytoactinopolyspora halophila TaxID=1981511 RepID=A0A329Q9Z7_9ACTN|nr:aminoglycoside phosphotransferase [Actinobacteria bacterium YIM 96077]RAW09225.1 aminoglycoside phosphotransferase [Phytoactinopolyspora halophila]
MVQAVELLADWLPHQRWFAGRAHVDGLRIASATLLRAESPRVWHVLVEVRQGDVTNIYQVPLAIRSELVDRLEYVHLGQTDHGHVYDALHDKSAAAEILACFADEHHAVGDLTFHREADAEVPFGEAALALPVEQSNTSLAFSDSALLKVFRRLQAGMNPDVEVHAALTRAGSEYVAPMLAWIEGRWADEHGASHQASLAMLQKYLTTASDGWALAAASVRDLYAEGDLHADEVGGDFAAESHRLGEATAEVHKTMAAALPTGTFDRTALAEKTDVMLGRLDHAATVVPELEPYLPSLRRQLERLRYVDHPVPVQRVHGDYHLGQVLRTVVGWKLVDFEGEPARTLAERTALDSPIRDVAGMLRSFDYAARYLLITDYEHNDPAYDQISYRAAEWAQRNRDAFCDGYATTGAPDPRQDPALLCAYEIDKAVYEVVYEARYRPAWLPIPLAAVERLAASPSP